MFKSRRTEAPPLEPVDLTEMEWRLGVGNRPDGLVRLEFAVEADSIVPEVGETVTLRVTKVVREVTS